ncbi:MAG TPA: anti-sigma regulatory factor [Solirubrobacteraceae bacterium]|nr:anti-sigma regulatory factor [Solirubrobacteraceae bacterium]
MSVVSCIAIEADVDIITARQRGRDLGTELGLPKTELALIATAISELARNILTYAGEGEIQIAVEEGDGRRGIAVVARDEGPGIADIGLALQDGYSTSHSLGIGLPGVRRLMDEFEVTSEPGCGTVVRATKWQ